MSDNFQLVLRDSSRENFTLAIKLIMAQRAGGALYYASHPRNGVVLFWSKPELAVFRVPGLDGVWQGDHSSPETDFRAQVTKLPYKLTAESAPDFLWGFLREMEYPAEPDHDGDNEKGYHITSGDGWGMIGDSNYALLQVLPLWMMHGK
jgi:hypothetical protein